MAVLGKTGDKVLGAGVASGASSGLSVGGPVGAVVGAFVGAAAGLFAGKSAQNKADKIKQYNDARQGINLLMGVKYRFQNVNTSPPKQGSLGAAIQGLTNQTVAGIANGTITSGEPVNNSDPDYSVDENGNAYYMGVKLVPDTSKYLMPDGSLMADQDFSFEIQRNTGKLLNSLGYGVTLGPIIDNPKNPSLGNVPYVYTSPSGSKLTADIIHTLYSQGVTINNLSPAAMLASGIPQNTSPLKAGFSGSFGSINPIAIILIVLVILLFIYKRS